MNYILFAIRSALADFARNKGRTLLTSLGILIGVLAVVLLTAFGLGLKRYIGNQFESLGANLMIIMPGKKETMMRGGGLMGGIKFDEKDATKLARIKNITHLAPMFAKSAANISANGKTEIIDVIASNEEVSAVMNLEIEEGRLLEKRDIQKGAKVLVIASTYAKKFYPTVSEALGKSLDIEGQSFKIIGITKSKGGGGMGGDVDANVYVPFKSTVVFNPEKKYFAIYFKVDNKENIPAVTEEVKKILGKRYDKDAFSVMEQTELMNSISSIFNIVNTVLIAIAAISLVVGGIGIMNIMYVTVTERIKEIGIRRALGARKNDILLLFLVEAIILSVLGGLLGLLLSYAIVLLIQPLFPAYIDISAVILALGVSSLIGIVFGVFPAKKAADLSPIDAIRYE